MKSVIDERNISTLFEVPALVSPVDEKYMSTVLEVPMLAFQVAAILPKKSASKTFEGKIVSMTGDKLVMISQAGTNYSHTLAQDSKLTCDGRVCQAGDLKAGRKIRVTTQQDDRNVVTGIDSLNKNAEFAQCS